ncbi:vitamin D3 receptor-like isoform X1 [Pomacea canaliculata]|uniref:vitamin D3 receptor-like isoform X1 n=2 Tax=Pomacea canaliculata TaxID=400727 RepID=UPI000D7315B0|nr:vitamin D3 receptor-like isoform X1 [Pomacea canaliculata]
MQITSSALSEVVGLKGRSEAMDRTTKPGHCPSKQENRTEESGSNCARAGIKKHARCGGRRRQATSSRTCSVCGDTAFAHNFGVLTCETCKAFFRRNAMKEDSLQCVFDGNCSIDVRSRRLCSACRLKKCLDMGMKRQLILDEDRKKARRLRRMGMNSQKEQMSASGQLLPATPEEACPIIPDHHHVTPSCHAIIPGHFSDQMQSSTSTFIEEFFKQALQDTQQGEDDISLLRVSLTLENPSISSFLSSSAVDAHVSSTPDLQPEELQQQVHEVTATTSPVASSSYPAGVFRGWTHEFRHVPREQLPSDMKQYWMLTREERSLLTHLATAYQDATMNRAPHDGAGRYDNDDGDYISLEVCMQLLERLLHRGVQFAKAVPEFQKLPREVQIGSLKSSAHCATIIDLSATYIIERRIWATELGEFLIDRLPSVLLDDVAKEELETFSRTLKAVAKNDVTIYALLHVLVLLDPRNGPVEGKQLLNACRDRYWILLKHYLEAEFSYQHAEDYLMAFMEGLYSLRKIAYTGFAFVERFSSSLKPLAAEMLQDSTIE